MSFITDILFIFLFFLIFLLLIIFLHFQEIACQLQHSISDLINNAVQTRRLQILMIGWPCIIV
jgi:hypothetical protein